MQPDECLRVLGISAGATGAEIRQAYLDLVRIWHPDRFEADPRLRQFANNHLYEINEAYFALRGRSATAGSRSRPDQARSAEVFSPAPVPGSFAKQLGRFRTARAALLMALCLAPVWAAVELVTLLRVPVLDAGFFTSAALRPRILAPMRIIDPRTDVRVAADTLAEWARGDVLDLWGPLSGGHSRYSPPITRAIPGLPQPPIDGPARGGAKSGKSTVWRQANRGVVPSSPESGVELLHAGRLSGAGELRIVNNTRLEAVAILVRRRSGPERAMFVAPNDSASIRFIALGLYDLDIRLGRGLDVQNLLFQNDAQRLDTLGAFEFFEITDGSGTSGHRYEVRLNPAGKGEER